MNDLISQIERGEVIVAELVDGNLTQLVPDFNKTAELLRLIRNPWIPVTPETMPEDGKPVLIYSALTEKFGVSDVVSELVKYPNGYFTVTHWMPLPALPEQEGVNGE
ncbi:MAG: hypothetical protein K0Q85_5 [Caproiciproducens sp.]|jgi:hypothetical protein|nr:hypothetical protein [Caproiciproducens sp.]